MKCPHCLIGVSIEWETFETFSEPPDHDRGFEIACAICPECERPIVKLVYGKIREGFKKEKVIDTIYREEIVYPRLVGRILEPEILDPYRRDFQEACAVLNLSPKASAALSRRLLQTILRQEFTIQHQDLAQEIAEFIKQPGVPSHLVGAIDAIRNVGNFAAHPLKDTHTGEIVDVEPGEAEWLLDVLEELFDFTFVQPKRLEGRKQKLNDKLKALGKPPMKG